MVGVIFQLRLVRSTPPSKEFEKNFVESHEVYQKYQVSVHNDDPSDVSEKQFRRFLCTSPLEVLLLVMEILLSYYSNIFFMIGRRWANFRPPWIWIVPPAVLVGWENNRSWSDRHSAILCFIEIFLL